MTSSKHAGITDRFKRVVESNPVGAAGLAMGTYFGARIGHQHDATAAGVAGAMGGMIAGDQIMRRAFKTNNPYAVFGATIGSAMLPIYTAQIAARVVGRDPREVAMMRAQGHKLASKHEPWDEKSPPSSGKKLSPEAKARAKARAKKAGRPYPNWVDNSWAAKTAGIQDALEKAAEAWQRKEGKNPEGGLNAKGRASLKAKGQNIKPPVSSKQAKRSPKAAKRRKSFCARMSGMPGPMKDEKGRPTRKALSLRKWDC